MTAEEWAIGNTIAQIVAAFGTLAAVVVALYLARHQGAPRLTMTTSILHVVTPGIPGSHEGRFLRISISNAGYGDVTVTSFEWKIGRFRRAHLTQLLPLNAMSATLPAKLTPSDTATFMYPWDEYVRNSMNLRRAFGEGPLGRRRARTTRLIAWLSTGEHRRVRIDRDVADKLFEAPR